MRNAWAAEIEALRVAYQAAVEVHRPAEAAATVAEVAYRSAVRAAQARLMSFKRDLQSLGLTEPQIHQIIPDAATTGAPSLPTKPDGPGTPTAGSSPHAGA